jgi:hypothetical protein
MAREAGMNVHFASRHKTYLAAFEALVRAEAIAEEREACAKLVEVPAEWEDWEVDCGEQGREMCNNLAAAIRARGENT